MLISAYRSVLRPSNLKLFRSKNLRCIVWRPILASKNSGSDHIYFRRKLKTLEKKFLFRKYFVSVLFFQYLYNGKRLNPQNFNLVFVEKYFRAWFLANLPGNHEPIDVLASSSHEEFYLYAKWYQLDFTYIWSSLSKSTELTLFNDKSNEMTNNSLVDFDWEEFQAWF